MSDKFLSDQEVAAIKRHYKETVAQNQRLTDKELETAILVAEKRQLYPPPLGNHIFFMKRKNREQLEDGSWGDVYVLSLQTGIDGFRLIAERTNKYVGSGVPEYENDASGFVKRAIIRVEKLAPDGSRAIVGADAWFEEYAQYSFKKGGEKALTKMWAEKGRLMLSKCAEALALRKAFPELSGLYTTDEMGAQDDGTPEVPAPRPPPLPPPLPPPTPRVSTATSVGARAETTGSATRGVQPASASTAVTTSPSGGGSASAAAKSSVPGATTGANAVQADGGAAPATPSPSGPSPDTFADPERKKKLANAMALSCSTFGVTRPEMVKLVRAWAPRPAGEPAVIGDAGNLNAQLLESDRAKIVDAFKRWEADKRDAIKAKASQDADAEADKWEKGESGVPQAVAVADDDIPF